MDTPELLMALPILVVSALVPGAILILGIALLDPRGAALRWAPERRPGRLVLRRGV
jgi:hypothetical protein